MTAKTKRTRGPRTAHEKAHDAARSTATLFEKLPPSHYADELLKPLAVLLRLDHSRSDYYLDPDKQEDAARAYLALVEWWKWVVRSATSERLAREFERAEELRDQVSELEARLLEGVAAARPQTGLSLVTEPDSDDDPAA